MKNLINTSIAMMALTTSGCATPVKASISSGRIIEFKSDASGFDTRTFFYEGENEVVAFDAQFTSKLAEDSIVYLRQFTKKPISWLVITHPNPDKFNGASVFKAAGAKIIASQSTAQSIPGVHAYKEYFFVEMAKMFKKGEYPQPVAIDQVFKGNTDLVLRGGERIELRELSQPGVSSTQSVAFIKSANALLVGDLVHYKAHAWLEGGIVNGNPTPTIKGWIATSMSSGLSIRLTQKSTAGVDFTTDLETSVTEQIAYLQTAEKLVSLQLAEMGSSAKEFMGPNAGKLYKGLAQKFEQSFPDYELSYMIEYGAYGFVQSELQKLK